LALIFSTPSLCADSKSGVGLSKISLPSGPGSIEGLGDSFEPQLNSGTAAYSVKVAIPPGVNGLQPEVVLRYNGGSGNGPFGLAWNYEPLSIQRETQKGLPTYGASDVFVFQGEELVPLSDGSYRCKNESAFMRVTRAGDGWQVTEKTGKVHLLGISAQSRVSKPANNTFASTFKWCEEQVFDTHSNQIQFLYSTYPDSTGQVYCTEIHYSISGQNPAVFHSVAFDYELRPDAFSSFLSGFEVKTGRRCQQINVLSNGELVRSYGLGYEVNTNDVIEPVSANDAGLSFSLLRRVTQFDRSGTSGSNYLPPLQFGYTRFDAGAGVRGYVSNQPPYSLGNANLAIADINCDSLPDLFYTDPFTGQHSVYYNLGPPQSATTNGQSAIVFAAATPFAAYPINLTLNDPGIELADFDGDGRVDFIQKTGDPIYGQFVFYPNTTLPIGNDDTRPSWGGIQSFPGPLPPLTLDDPSARTLDLNGDKRMDFMRTTSYGFVYFYNNTNGWRQDGLHPFGDPAMGDITAADNVQFSVIGSGGTPVPNKLVKLADMNGDRLLDLVSLTVFGTQLRVMFWPNKGWGAWANRVLMSGTIDLGVIPVDDVFVMDINGDGLADIVAVGYNYILYWINQGNGSWSPMFTRTGMPAYQRGVTVLRQADINGNGSTDFIWENWDAVARAYRTEFYDFLGAGKPNLLATVDNGIGLRTTIDYKTTTDYYVAARQAGNPWHTRLPFASQVVSKITKTIGLDLDQVQGPDQYITEFSYYDGYYDSFMKEFRGFAFAKKVDRGDDFQICNLQSASCYTNSPSTITRFAFHTGTPDGIDYSGYGGANVFDPISGWPQEPLKGRVLWTEVTLPTADFGGAYPAQTDGQMADDSVVFTREINNWRIKIVHNATNGFTYTDAFGTAHPDLSLPFITQDSKRVQYAFLANHIKRLLEANGTLAGADPFTPVRSPKQTYVETDVDYFGNTIAERNFGQGSPGGTNADQRFIYTTYAFNVAYWLVGLPASHRVADRNGVFVAETHNYYDGADFTGLPLGQAGALGDMMREEHLINGTDPVPVFSAITTQVGDPRLGSNASINGSRNRYDIYGNLVETRDPLYQAAGQGHAKQYGYDSVFNTYVTQELIHVGGTNADLVAQAAYDYGAGAMTSSVNFNGQVTSYLYDSFWRLVGIVKPGDSDAFPTATFTYTPADPFRNIYYIYDPAGNLTVTLTGDTSIANAVATHQRTTAGSSDTFDTISFTDGAGHKLGTLEQDDVPGLWVAKDFKLFSTKGQERGSFLPFVVGHTNYQAPDQKFANVASFYDSPDRVVRTLNPPETALTNAPQSETRTVYLPLETIVYDEEQANPSSPRFGAYHSQLKDGLDRLVGVTEAVHLNDDGTPSTAVNQWLTSYEYDLNDNLTHITDSQANQKWFRYDGLKRKLFMNDPDRGTMTYVYDASSNLGQTVDAKAQQITFTYDGVNRLLTEIYHDGKPLPPWLTNNPSALIANVVYHYDSPAGAIDIGDGTTATPQNTKGMLAYVEDLSGEEHTSYDARGRVAFVVKRIPDPVFQYQYTNTPPPLVAYRTGFAYDSLDRVTTLTFADDDTVTYAYNARNLLKQIIGGPNGTVISNILYQPSAQLQEIDYGNGVKTTYGYDPRLRLSSLHTQNPAAGTDLIDFSYDFDRVSNIKDILDHRPTSAVPAGDSRRNTQLFAYDDLYRITYAGYSFAGPGLTNLDGGSIDYRYDRIGNMLAQTSDITNLDSITGLPVANLGNMLSGGSSGASGRIGRQPIDPPGPHALSQISNLQTAITNRLYCYDGNGNMLNIDGLTNTWDFKDRLVSIENTNMRAIYTYDYTDRRISKVVFYKTNGLTSPTPSLTTLYADKYFEVRENDTPTKYVWNGNTRVARMMGSSTNSTLVQRIRLYPGLNLVSLTVTGTNFLSQISNPQFQVSATKWDQPSQTWLLVSTTETLPALTVVWLSTSNNTLLRLVGAVAPPSLLTVPTGASYQPASLFAAAFRAYAWPTGLMAAKFDAMTQAWQTQFSIPLQPQSYPSLSVAANDAIFVRTSSALGPRTNVAAASIHYYHEDHLGSSSAVSDQTGDLVEEVAYHPFSYARSDISLRQTQENYRFTQKERDSESGGDYFEARFLLPLLDRFNRVDPVGSKPNPKRLANPQMLGPYAYCQNNPVTAIDPNGCEEATGSADSAPNEGSHSAGGGSGSLQHQLDSILDKTGKTAQTAAETLEQLGVFHAAAGALSKVDIACTVGGVVNAYSESFSKGTAKGAGEIAKTVTTSSILRNVCPAVTAKGCEVGFELGLAAEGVGALPGCAIGAGAGALSCSLGAVYIGSGVGDFVEHTVQPPIQRGVEKVEQTTAEATRSLESNITRWMWSQGGGFGAPH
jgi:RHS repeat-associated protein